MRNYILSDRERGMIKRFLDTNETSETFRMLKMRIKRNHDQLKKDLDLMEQALKKFQNH